MLRFVRKIARLAALEWSKALQYRFDIAAWTIAEASIPLVSLAIWYAVALNAHAGPSPRETLTYYVAVIFIKITTDAWNGFFTAWEILQGEIVKFLIRPFPILWHDLMNNLVEKSIKLSIPLPLFLAAIALFPHWFSGALYEPRHWLYFIPSLALAIILAFVLETIFGFAAFWLEEAQQIRSYKSIFETVASGVLIPFTLMPPAVHTALSLLPFRYIVSAPAEILTGQAEGVQVLSLLGIQLAWITGLSLVSLTMWRAGLKRYAVPGQ